MGAHGLASVPSVSHFPEIAAWLIEFAKRNLTDEVEAGGLARWARTLNPQSVEGWNGEGKGLMLAGQNAKALERFSEAARLAPDNPRLLVNMAAACHRMRRFDEAELYCKQALAIDPKCIPAYIELAGLYQELWRLDDSLKAAQDGLAIDPSEDSLLFGRAVVRLHRGDFKNGWKDYESRPSRMALLPNLDECEEWNGKAFKGTLLVLGEQGLGDQIMFARYLVPALERCPNITLFTYPNMARLMAEAFPSIRIVTSQQELESMDPPDRWIGIGSLPLALGAEKPLECPPYLRAAQVPIPHSGFRVGLCWAGNPGNNRDPYRSIPWAELKPLLDVPGVEFVSLQYRDSESGLPNLCGIDMLDTAEAIKGLDLVISVDTATAHLSGALGIPTWILLRQPWDWRWERKGAYSPWYESATIYRDCAIEGITSWLHENTPGVWKLGAGRVEESQIVYPSVAEASIPVTSETVEGRYGTFHCQADDFWITRSLKLYGEWSQGECDLYARIVKPGDTVVEVGSNIGTHTVPLARLVGKTGTVIAFEALLENSNLLLQNVQDESVRNQVIRVEMALGNGEDGKFIRTGDHTTSGSEFNGGRRFDDFLEGQRALDGWTLKRLDLMKLDCEGSELRVLKGAEKAIMLHRPILYIENNPGPQTEPMILWLHEHGYRLHQHQIPLYSPNNFRGYRVNVFGGAMSFMLLCIPAERYDIHFDDIPRLRVSGGNKP